MAKKAKRKVDAATQAAAEEYVLNYFHRRYPNADLTTDLRNDLNLDSYDLHDFGRELRGWRGVTYEPDEFLACKKLSDIVDLLLSKL